MGCGGSSSNSGGVSDKQKQDIARARAARSVTSFDRMVGEGYANDKLSSALGTELDRVGIANNYRISGTPY